MEREFKAFPSIPRLSKDMVITEKIDGTNACVVITEDGDIFAQSRGKLITPEDDNYGFAKWVDRNKEELAKLGVGYHYGERRGNGIQRKYNQTEKRFSLFYFKGEELPNCVTVVPVLYTGPFDTAKIQEVMNELHEHGSYASEGFMKPEGIIVYHTAGKCIFKKTFENDEGKRTQK